MGRKERFIHPTEWIAYLIEHFIVRWGYVLNGDVEWDGEGNSDIRSES